jgi:hypothetical protein
VEVVEAVEAEAEAGDMSWGGQVAVEVGDKTTEAEMVGKEVEETRPEEVGVEVAEAEVQDMHSEDA